MQFHQCICIRVFVKTDTSFMKQHIIMMWNTLIFFSLLFYLKIVCNVLIMTHQRVATHSLKNIGPVPYYSKCDPWTSRMGISWELVRSGESLAQLQTCWIRICSRHLRIFWRCRFWFNWSGVGLRFFIYNKFPGDVDAAAIGTILRVAKI